MAEQLPPLTADDIRGPLTNPTFSVYLYIGNEADEGWDNAQLAFGLLSRLRIYLVHNIDIVREWVGNKQPSGVVFGWGPNPVRYLTSSEAAEFKTVLNAIIDARR